MHKGKTPINVDRKSIDKNTIKRLMSYMKVYKLKFSIVIICIILTSIVSAANATAIRILIDDYITPLIGVENPSYVGIVKVISILITIFLIGVIASFIYTRIMVDISQSILNKIRNDMFSHMQKLPIRYFDTNSHGDVMSHYTNDVDSLRQALSQSIPQLFSAIITVTSVFVTMVSTSLYLTLFVILFLCFQLYCVKEVAGKSSKYFRAQQKALGELNGYIEEMINGQKVVKVFCYEEKAKEEFDKKNNNLRENTYKANTFANTIMPMTNNLGILQYILLAIIGGALAINNIGGVTIGAIIAFLMLSRSFNAPIAQVSQQMNFIVMSLAGAKRIFELLDEKIEEDTGYVTLVNAKYENGNLVEVKERTGIWAWKHPHKDGSLTYTQLTGEVEFNDVDFGYTEEKIVLHNVTLDAKQGQKIAFVGATGAGKTTITNLINRFYDIADGKIRYDGININKIKKPDLRRSLGVVLQDTNLFTGTVIENIRYGNLNATDEECIEAAKKANAHHFIELLKDGYNTVISGSGEGLSQGQKQLLSIARAIVADPPVMILDEATSSIDTHTEAIVQKGMDMLMNGRTVFVIAHRLSTIQNSDKIIVLDKGRIIESGNHNELIEQKGKYYQLYTGAIEMD
ncbi:ABC transporter ATP-binding protein [uncultured Tyzzerella sp.]|uniref:ABC transporter ATP-binding protein n=1 Tax=uncultured Tyzzerella sp. TaxID=2321398 RepID=UPI00294303C2|nr:ABC transporter ATP-binding protein [uncultured Tyzzerella sp.]